MANSKFQIPNSKYESGQALITLLFFMIVAITITSAATMVTLVNSVSTSTLEQTNAAYVAAESGAENALLKLIRDPSYTGIGDSAPIGDASMFIEVSGLAQKIVTSTATLGGFLRKVEVQVSYANGILTVSSWKEVL